MAEELTPGVLQWGDPRLGGDALGPQHPPLSITPVGRTTEAPQLKQHGPYDRELGIFGAMMRHKMENNRHRGRWQDMSLADAIAGIRRELAELEEAISRGDVPDILLEAADVANFALIAAFVAMEVKNEPKRAEDRSTPGAETPPDAR